MIRRISSIALYDKKANDFVNFPIFTPCLCSIHLFLEVKQFGMRRFLFDALQVLLNNYCLPIKEINAQYKKHGLENFVVIVDGFDNEGYSKKLFYQKESTKHISITPSTPSDRSDKARSLWQSSLQSSNGDIEISNHLSIVIRHDGPMVFLEPENLSSGFYDELIQTDNQSIFLTCNIEKALGLIDVARSKFIAQEDEHGN